eukprot:4533797-Amphidinium_carterae.1
MSWVSARYFDDLRHVPFATDEQVEGNSRWFLVASKGNYVSLQSMREADTRSNHTVWHVLARLSLQGSPSAMSQPRGA